jgi:PAS domain S-box-containing protein
VVQATRFELEQQPAVLATVSDITERKMVEEEVQSARAFLDRVIEFSPFALWISDRAGTLLRANRVLCEALNVSEAQIVGKYNVFQDANLEREGLIPQVRRVYEQQEPTRFSLLWMASQVGEGDFGGARDLYLDASMFPIVNPQGRLTHVVCQWVDITERKRTEEALARAHTRLRQIIDANIVGILVAEAGGRVVEANDYYLKLIGFTREEFNRGQVNWRAITPSEWLPVDERALRELRERGSCTPYEKEYVRRDGTRVPVLLVDAMLPGPERQIAAFALDLTKRKQAEQELRIRTEQIQALYQRLEQSREEERTRMAQEVHNVLGQHVTALKMDVAWWRRRFSQLPDATLREQLEKKAEATDRLAAEIVEMVQQIARELRPSVLDNIGLGAALQFEARRFAERSGLQCQVTLAGEIPALDPGQATGVFRVFQELLTNVARHARATQVSVALTRMDSQLVLEVTDNGCGISTAATAAVESLGVLGMRERAAMIGAELKLVGEPGKGTIASLILPLA